MSDGVRLIGYMPLHSITIDGVKLSEEYRDEFRDFVSVAAEPITGTIDITDNVFDALAKSLGLPRDVPPMDVKITSRKPQLLLQRRRSGWRSRLRFLVIAETYKGATIEFVE